MNTRNHVFRLGLLTVLLLLVAGMGASTDLTGIGTINPSGSTLTLGGDLDMSGNSITNSFSQGTCDSGNVMIGINSDGTIACDDATTQVQGDFVSRAGDSMTGSLDLSSGSLILPTSPP